MSNRQILTTGAGGKDVVMIASPEELSTPSKITLPEPEPTPGLILADGSINWGCPCLGGMATGPCGIQFRDAFSCFHYSEAEPKGSDCYEKFSVMQQCMSQYPQLYNKDDDDELAEAMSESTAEANSPSKTEASSHSKTEPSSPSKAGAGSHSQATATVSIAAADPLAAGDTSVELKKDK